MLQKSRGIVLSYIKFKETSVIVKVYTELFGTQSYIINGIRSKASKKSLALFQPLTLLDLVIYTKKNENKQDGIKRLSEYKPIVPFKSIPFDIKKSSIAIFVTELISKSMKEEQSDENGAFDFLYRSILYLDTATVGYENFHTQLMIQLANYIGFGITGKQDIKVLKSNFIGVENFEETISNIFLLKQISITETIKISNQGRKNCLNLMITYYASHIEGFGNMKSKSILHQVFVS